MPGGEAGSALNLLPMLALFLGRCVLQRRGAESLSRGLLAHATGCNRDAASRFGNLLHVCPENAAACAFAYPTVFESGGFNGSTRTDSESNAPASQQAAGACCVRPYGKHTIRGIRAMTATIACRALLSAAALLLAACAGNPTVQQTVAQDRVDSEYRIGPGDGLKIFVWNHPDLSVEIPVRPDGKISTPLVENIEAAGKTPSELAREIESRLAEYVRAPRVNVIVTNFVGVFSDQIRVVGQAVRPQSLPYRANMTVLDVLIQVGGLAEFAAGNRAKLVRQVEGKTIEIPVRLHDLLNKGDVRANVPVQPGDVLIIPESRF